MNQISFYKTLIVNVSLMVENLIQSKSGITININVGVKIRKNIICVKKDCIWNPPTCSYKNNEYLPSVVDHSVITCEKIIEETQIFQQVLTRKKVNR